MSRNNNLVTNWWLFPGFTIEPVVTGLDLPVNLAFVPKPNKKPGSPFLYVTELYWAG